MSNINFSIALIYIGFFSLIGAVVFWTQSGWPLWALLLMPSVSTKSKTDGESE